MEAKAREVIKDPVNLPSLPTLYLQLREAIDHPKGSLMDVSKIIRNDTSLAARLLRIVNSAYYALPSRVETIQHAISILGTQALCELVLATSVVSIFKNVPAGLVDMKSFWRHSLATGLIAKALGQLRGESDLERFFMIGLLHDIGRLVLYLKSADGARVALERARRGGTRLLREEREVLGTDHAEVGQVLLEAWRMPLRYQEAVGCHHEVLAASRFPLETATVHIADLIANALQLGSSGEILVPLLEPAAWARLDLPAESVQDLFKEAQRQLEEAEENFL